MARLLGVRLVGVDGNTLADALAHPSIQERRRQANLARALTPLVVALKQRSGPGT
jgi:hypothetical protein